MRAKHFILHICFLFLFVFIPQNAYTDTSPLAPHLLEPEAYSEIYHAVLNLEEGIHIQVQFAITNLGIGDQNCMCRVLFIDEKDAWNNERIFSKRGWSYEPPGHLKVGNCYISAGKDSTLIFAEGDNAAVEVKFPGSLQSVKPPDHLIQAGEDFFDSQILMPWSPAEVRIDMQEQPARLVTGYGSMYHFWVTAWPADVARQWVRVFGMNAEGAFIIMSRFPPEKNSAAAGSIWVPGAPGPVAFDSFHIEKSPSGIKTLNISSGKNVYRLFIKKQLYRHAPLEKAGLLGRIIGIFMGNWVTRTYQARLEMPGSGGPGQAIVEITADE